MVLGGFWLAVGGFLIGCLRRFWLAFLLGWFFYWFWLQSVLFSLGLISFSSSISRILLFFLLIHVVSGLFSFIFFYSPLLVFFPISFSFYFIFLFHHIFFPSEVSTWAWVRPAARAGGQLARSPPCCSSIFLLIDKWATNLVWVKNHTTVTGLSRLEIRYSVRIPVQGPPQG